VARRVAALLTDDLAERVEACASDPVDGVPLCPSAAVRCRRTLHKKPYARPMISRVPHAGPETPAGPTCQRRHRYACAPLVPLNSVATSGTTRRHPRRPPREQARAPRFARTMRANKDTVTNTQSAVESRHTTPAWRAPRGPLAPPPFPTDSTLGPEPHPLESRLDDDEHSQPRSSSARASSIF
jgi:hypothetical protein